MKKTQSKGTRLYRCGVYLFCMVLFFLLWWSIGYLLKDFSSISEPNQSGFKNKYVEQADRDHLASLNKKMAFFKDQITTAQKQQSIVTRSTNSYQKTMNQLLDMQRVRMEKGEKVLAEDNQVLTETRLLFLQSQKRIEELNQKVLDLNDQHISLSTESKALKDKIDKAEDSGLAEYNTAHKKHKYRVGLIKLFLLLPLLLGSSYFSFRFRKSVYRSIIFTFLLASGCHTGFVMHSHFPSAWYKYFFIGTSIILVVKFLIFLLRSINNPQKDLLLKRYRESFQSFLCPICDYPIRRGPLKYVFWTRKTLKKIVPVFKQNDKLSDEPYTCPSCGTELYAKCSNCSNIRNMLLPHCEHCGDQLEYEEDRSD